MSYLITIPFPPSVNTYYRRSQYSTYMSKKGREFSKDVATLLKDKMLDQELISSRLSVTLELSAPNRRKYDIDNRIKAALDALQKGGLFVDDEQIDRLVTSRLEIDENKKGYCNVKIELID